MSKTVKGLAPTYFISVKFKQRSQLHITVSVTLEV